MTTDWQEPLTAAEVVDRLTIATGRDPEVASAMIRDYLDDTSERLGSSVNRWGLHTGDVDEIRRGYEWVDPERGETAAQAHARAAEYAEGWAEIAGMAEDSPGYSAQVDRQASLWAERARDFEPRAEDETAREAVSAATVRDRRAAYVVGDGQQDGDEDGGSR
ncbi:hypothetical protein LWC35_10690 [Pseudonocardia kujensis]|uniref:hypothetical protein n=1 Tax=Pseudonocardia kujensis TaxID=1128675 RepID=UPI001E2CBB3E|nr:hypothetical protein [Pseudonocardia kujensis]MCE0763368.1 hypothetical protein [Pseudonocardia kujensis]